MPAGQALAYIYARETKAQADTAKVLTRTQQNDGSALPISAPPENYSGAWLAVPARDGLLVAAIDLMGWILRHLRRAGRRFLMAAASKGQFHSSQIKNSFPYSRV